MAVDDTKQPPVITTEWGPVTEGARLQAARNYRRDPAKLAKAIQMFGEARMRRDFPEAFEADEADEDGDA
jgi:hypothetical protein